MKKLLMGNEAIGIAALKAGVNFVSGYPGTPSSEVLETVSKYNDGTVHVEWSVNEKVALEAGAGAAYAGARTLVTMKQVGLNVASDPLMSLAYIGVKGGMVILSADDPGPISSQTEQDTRKYGGFCKLPVFDPSTPEEAYEMTGKAFELSEKLGIAVIMRPTTRVCHACASIDVPEEKYENKPEGFVKDSKWAIFPALSYRNHIKLENIMNSGISDESAFNSVKRESLSAKSVIASGAAFCYANEAVDMLSADVKLIKLGLAVPFPENFLLKALDGVDEVLVAEELDPVIEDCLYALKGKYNLNLSIHGKRDGVLPYAGEYSVEILKSALGSFCKIEYADDYIPSPKLPVRPPVLCAGCPHRASFYAVKTAMKNIPSVFSGDIGCYTLGNAKPLDMVDTCLCMGAGITIAQGLQHIQPDVKHFAFIGDSTFFHSGITGVINAVYNNAPVNIIILDNSTTAMTGHQPHPGTGRTMMGNDAVKADIEAIVRACGVKDVAVVDPLELDKAKEAVKKAADYDGVSVIIFRSPCIAVVKSKKHVRIDYDRCINCKRCINELGCPAMSISAVNNKIEIDASLCTGCGLCAKVCKPEALINYEA